MYLHVVHICSGIGFPVGLATTQTIGFIGRALTEAGVSVTVLHCGPHPYLKLLKRTGEYKGVSYRYLSLVTHRPSAQLTRCLIYLCAYIELAYRLARMRLAWRRDGVAVCLHAQGDVLNAYVGGLCRCLAIPVVLESCEWIPEIQGTSRVKRWIHGHMTFQFCSGAIVISQAIQDKIQLLPVYRKRRFPIYRRTVFVDPSEYVNDAEGDEPESRSVVWCGDATAYVKDVLFLVSVASKQRDPLDQCVLEIVGPFSNDARKAIEDHSRTLGFPPHRLVLRGYVARGEFLRACKKAAVLVQPLWDDGQSRARVPNKLGEYLMSGTPVVTCAIGEVREYLTDGVNTMFYQQGDAADCEKIIAALLRDQAKAQAIGLAGRHFAERVLSYKMHAVGLQRFFLDVAVGRGSKK
jgi:glycosyltransferase involved in cell wall biosynthesis